MTSRITVLDNDRASMWYYPQKKIVHHQFHKYLYGQGFQELMMTGVKLLKQHKAQKWLSDDRGMPVLRQEDMEWGKVTWFPACIEAGWKYWAIVQPEAPVGQMVMDNLIKFYSEQGITTKFFTDPDEAMKWLESF